MGIGQYHPFPSGPLFVAVALQKTKYDKGDMDEHEIGGVAKAMVNQKEKEEASMPYSIKSK